MSRSALLVTAAVTLGGPVETCRKMLGFDSGVQAAYGAVPPPPTVAVPAYGVVPMPPMPADAGATDASADAKSDAKSDAAVKMSAPAYGLAPPRQR